jgi:uncharacterized protein (DUF2164 family)
MNKFKLDDIKKLYYEYSPLKTNQELVNLTRQYIGINVNTANVRELYNKIISKYFINETVIKSAFLERVSFKKSPKSTVTIFELNSGDSRADICMVNGKSIVYEIKTEYDTYNRLDNQIRDYLKLHDYVNVIVPKSQLDNILKIIPDGIGVIFYTQNRVGNISFKEYKQPKLNENIDSLAQLSQLTKKELVNIICNNYLPKDRLIDIALDIYDKTEINNLFRESLKLKYFEKWNFLYTNQKDLYPLDYQWFFKNNLSTETVYK